MTKIVATGVTLVALATLSGVVRPPAAAARGPLTSLVLRAAVTSEHQIPSGYTLSEVLSKDGARVGTSSGRCLEAHSAKAQPTSATCRVTLKLTGGTIIISFKILFATDSGTLNVVGGTGTYAAARGTGALANGTITIKFK
jgi:hypothetical protein